MHRGGRRRHAVRRRRPCADRGSVTAVGGSPGLPSRVFREPGCSCQVSAPARLIRQLIKSSYGPPSPNDNTPTLHLTATQPSKDALPPPDPPEGGVAPDPHLIMRRPVHARFTPGSRTAGARRRGGGRAGSRRTVGTSLPARPRGPAGRLRRQGAAPRAHAADLRRGAGVALRSPEGIVMHRPGPRHRRQGTQRPPPLAVAAIVLALLQDRPRARRRRATPRRRRHPRPSSAWAWPCMRRMPTAAAPWSSACSRTARPPASASPSPILPPA